MSDFDYLSLSGRNLKAFLAVIEEGSVGGAAQRLGVTQSAVSHTLDRLREMLGDPLFVRSGRNIVPTAHALAAAEQARAVLDGMRALAGAGPFSAAGATMRLTVAANDLQRDVLLP
ncbi:LysR family transcriptional regulator, partial [bacterium]|nr:LysR family transcriptional regulator [bacterium]